MITAKIFLLIDTNCILISNFLKNAKQTQFAIYNNANNERHNSYKLFVIVFESDKIEQLLKSHAYYTELQKTLNVEPKYPRLEVLTEKDYLRANITQLNFITGDETVGKHWLNDIEIIFKQKNELIIFTKP